jgi:hypothetical protein
MMYFKTKQMNMAKWFKLEYKNNIIPNTEIWLISELV